MVLRSGISSFSFDTFFRVLGRLGGEYGMELQNLLRVNMGTKNMTSDSRHAIAVGYEIVVFLSCRGVADIRAAVREKKYRNPARED